MKFTLKIIMAVVFLMAGFTQAQVPKPVGLWDFNAGATTTATVGTDLTLTGSVTEVAGVGAGDDAVRFGNGTHYTATNPIGANGGGANTNEWTLLYDYKPTFIASWASILDLHDSNTDGEFFTRTDGRLGSADLTYAPAGSITAGWNRVVLRFDNGTLAELWVNGVKKHTYNTQSVDGRYSLLSALSFFQDGPTGGEEESVDLSTAALWDTALSEEEIIALGNAGDPIAAAVSPVLIFPLDSDSPTDWDLRLEWSAPEEYTPAGYYVYLDPNEGKVSSRDPSVKINTVLDPDPNYDVTGLVHGKRYYWIVEARQDPLTTPPTDPNWIPSSMGTFTTLPDEPVINTHPVSQTVAATTDVTFTVEAINATGYQWYADDVLMVGKTSPTLALTGVLKAQEGFYHCEVSNASDTVISDKARLMVQRRVALWTFEDTINSVVVTDEDAFTGTYNDPNDLAPAGPQYDDSDPSPQGGKAIKFSGDTTESEGGTYGESVSASDPDFFNFYPLGVTASAWVKYDPSSSGAWSTVVGKQHREAPTPWTGWGLIKESGDQAVFTTRQASSDVYGNSDLLAVNEDLGSTWHLVTGTYDGETTSVYVDGELQTTATSAVTMAINDKALIIGAERVDGLSPMNGLIDDLEIYNYALSRVEVAVLYTNDVSGAKICVEDVNDIDYDFNGDCRVNLLDFVEFVDTWLNCRKVPDCVAMP